MSTGELPDVVMIPVKRYDVSLTLEDILVPLTQTANHLTQAGQTQPELRAALDPAVAPLLQRFTDLVTQLKEVVEQINQTDPNMLASKPGPPPSA